MEYNRIIHGNNMEILPTLPAESVNCVVTSPPYWGLRDYGVKGQLGLEKTFEEYIKNLCDIFDEVKRVLRADGTCWVNLGDTYWGNKGNHYPAKSLCLIPQRFAIEMVNRGWILRNTIIWHKPNGMPASAKDRFTVDFEYLYFFTKSNKIQFWTNSKTGECVRKQPIGIKGIEGEDWEWREKRKKVSLWRGHDYWFEQQFEPHNTKDDLDRRKNKYWSMNIADGGSGKQNKGRDRREFYGKYGKNKRTVWTIPTQPFPEAHFAVFPEGFVEIPIKAGCPKYICKKCGMARMKIYKIIGKQITESMKIAGCNKEGKYKGTDQKDYKNAFAQGPSETKKRILESMSQIKESYYTDCGCNEGFEGGIVLDPFMGAGTTAVVAIKQGKRYLGIEISEKYIKIAEKRIKKIPPTLF